MSLFNSVSSMSQGDRTFLALVRHLKALGVARFEFGIHDAVQNQMALRQWTKGQTLHALPWLKHKNANGFDIYIRPLYPVGIILLDDLMPAQIPCMKHDGFAPAAVVQTSPGNVQAWIRLIANREGRLLPKYLLTHAAKTLAKKYQADPSSADWRHFGRAGGFTNRKPKHRHLGKYPYVLTLESSSDIASKGRNLLLEGFSQKKRRPVNTKNQVQYRVELSYESIVRQIMQNNKHQAWAKKPDQSRLDYMVVQTLLRHGANEDQIRASLMKDSPDLSKRKQNHVDDYINRTIKKAMESFLPPSSKQVTL